MKQLFLIEFDDVDYTSQQMQEFLSKIPHSKVTELTVPDDVREGMIEVIKKVHVLFYPKLFLGQDDLFKTTADALISAGYVREKSKAMTFEEYCLQCYKGIPTPQYNLPVDYAFAQANYTNYLALITK